MNNNINKALGAVVKDWKVPPIPHNLFLNGQFVLLTPLIALKHGKQLFDANQDDHQNTVWDYLPYGPFDVFDDYLTWLKSIENALDPYFLVIERKSDRKICGIASYLRINPHHGSIEVGHINFSPSLQKTTAATETMYLMMKWAFENGYRRYEWKCNTLNKNSRMAAQRLGLSYEGIFRQAAINKGRNRDTAWFAAIDQEWVHLKACFDQYLDINNFTAEGKQIIALSSLTKRVLFKIDPNLMD